VDDAKARNGAPTGPLAAPATSASGGSGAASVLRRLGESNWIGFAFLGLVLLLWEISVRAQWVQSFGFPAFSTVVVAFWQFLVSGDVVQVLLPSLQRWMIGYAIAIVVGVAVGLLMGYVTFFYKLLEPITELIRPIPSPAYVPVAIIFLGIDDTMKIFVIAFASFFPIMINTFVGVRSIDAVQMNTARTFGIPPLTTMWHVVLPAAAPYIFAGMRVSLALSLILTIIAEMIAGNSGIGYYILLAQRSFRVGEMYAGIIILGLIGYALNRLFLIVESRVLKWHLATTGKGSA
jgi:ABC-type nitrate/sulfonate/bicarbonate transport system permease component